MCIIGDPKGQSKEKILEELMHKNRIPHLIKTIWNYLLKTIYKNYKSTDLRSSINHKLKKEENNNKAHHK